MVYYNKNLIVIKFRLNSHISIALNTKKNNFLQFLQIFSRKYINLKIHFSEMKVKYPEYKVIYYHFMEIKVHIFIALITQNLQHNLNSIFYKTKLFLQGKSEKLLISFLQNESITIVSLIKNYKNKTVFAINYYTNY